MKTDEPPRAAYEDARRRLLQALQTRTEPGPLSAILAGALHARLGRLAVPAAIAAAAVFFLFNPFGSNPGAAYANAVQLLKEATTVAFRADWYLEGHDQPTHIDMAFRQPGLQRTVMEYEGAEIVQINDTVSDRGLVLIPGQRVYIALDLTAMPTAERERLALITQVTATMNTLPPSAERLEETRRIGDRTVHGYRAGHRTLWIDPATEELVEMDLVLGGLRMVMTEFRLDPPDLGAALFSTTPPEGYAPALQEALTYDVDTAGEEDLIAFLRFMAESRIDGVFPDSINPMEILTLEDRGLLRVDAEATPEEQEQNGLAFARASQRAVTFVMGMQPANDWRYAGSGVAHGAANTPIAWWKPSGKTTHRVIWADLSITEETEWDPSPDA
jgi:hypothetical protein